MLRVLVSDFYKLFNRRSFYVCVLIAMVLSAIQILTLSYQMSAQYSIPDLDLKMFGYNGISVITLGAASVPLVSVIFSSMFVVSEFSTGMVRTLLIRGINRFSFYFSKLVTVIVIPVIYTIFSCAASFAAGCYLWGMGEATNSIILNIVKSLAMFLAVQAALHSIYVMTVFLVRHSGAVVSANLALVIPIIPSLLCWLIETVLVKWFNIHKNVSEYWIGNYTSVDQIGLSHAFVVKILLISSVYFAVSTAIGCITFWKRDV